MPKSVKFFFSIFLFVGLTLIAAGLFWAIKEFQFRSQTETTPGTIIGHEEHEDAEGETTYRPVFQFQTPNGQTHTVSSSIASYPPRHREGETISVHYPAEQPEKAKIDSFTEKWLFPVAFAAFGAVFSLSGGLPIYIPWRNQKKHHQLLNTGLPITTTFNRIEQPNININGRSPCVIITHGYHPAQPGIITEFKSPYIWYDPTPYISQDALPHFTVYVNLNNSRAYAMDISSLPRIKAA